jgi:hypothetical protein
MTAMPNHLDEALYLFKRASPALRRFVVNVSAEANAPIFADPSAIHHATIVQAVQTASSPGDPNACPTKTVNNYMYSPTVRSVPGCAASAAHDGLATESHSAGDLGVGTHEWLEPVSFDVGSSNIGSSESILAPADPPTRPDDPWTPPARRPGEPELQYFTAAEPWDAASLDSLTTSGSSCSSKSIRDLPVTASDMQRDRPHIYGGVVASHVFENDGTTRLLSGRSLIEPKTGDSLAIIRHDSETVTILSIRVTGKP